MYTLENFFKGLYSVRVNKSCSDDIRQFWNIIEPYVKRYACPRTYDSALEYLLASETGPLHFMMGDMLNGRSKPRIYDDEIDLKDWFKYVEEPRTEIEEDEYMHILTGE